jgi:hypothetical protein
LGAAPPRAIGRRPDPAAYRREKSESLPFNEHWEGTFKGGFSRHGFIALRDDRESVPVRIGSERHWCNSMPVRLAMFSN